MRTKIVFGGPARQGGAGAIEHAEAQAHEPVPQDRLRRRRG